jgi:hypothetical protein
MLISKSPPHRTAFLDPVSPKGELCGVLSPFDMLAKSELFSELLPLD